MKEKKYRLSFQDRNGAELKTKEIFAWSRREAYKVRDIELAECNLNDCVQITVSAAY